MKNALLRRLAALIGAVMMCFALTVPALADDGTLVEGDFGRTYFTYFSDDTWSSIRAFRGGSSNEIVNGSSQVTVYRAASSGSYPASAYSLKYIDLTPLVSSYASYGFYISYVMCSTAEGYVQNKVPSSSDFSLYSVGVDGGLAFSSSVRSVDIFESSLTSDASYSDGVVVRSRFVNSIESPLENIYFCAADFKSNVPTWYFSRESTSTIGTRKIYIYSVRLVSTASSGELDALESMADAITAQNEILSAYYGDIVEICNQIYQRLGDMQAAQEEANALFSQIISLLNTTNGKLSAINQAMSTYFELLINQLKQEGVDIRTAIADAEARLELYLKPMIDYFTELEEQTGESASTLPQHKTDLDKWSSDSTGIDADAQTGLAAILPFLTAFSFIFSILGIFIGLGILRLIVKKGLS